MTPKQVHKLLQESTSKIKHKQTIRDFEGMQKFVTNSVHNNKLGGLINKTARLDAKLDAFMNDLSKTNKIPSSTDVSRKPTENEKPLTPDSEFEAEISNLIRDIKRTNDSRELKTIEERYLESKEIESLRFDLEGEFRMMILDQRVTTNTTSLRRINVFKALVWMGNMNGVVGYGKGRANNFKQALNRAIANAQESLVAINLDLLNTCPQAIYSKFARYQIILWPRKYNNAWGSPKYGAMLQMAGLHHCMFKFIFDTPNPYSLVYCLMKLLTQNTTPKLLAEELGQKLYDICWSRRRQKDFDMEESVLYE